MELLQLRYFIALVEHPHLTKTAENLFISPPALSMSLKRLEEELGVELFDRKKNRLILNKNGEMFYSKIKRGLMLIDNAVEDLCNNKTINIGAASPTIWSDFLTDYNAKYRDELIKLSTINVNEFISNYDKYNFYLGVTTYMNDKELEYEILLPEESMLAVISIENPLSKKDFLIMKDFENEVIITPSVSHQSMHTFINDLFKLKHTNPKKYLETDNFSRYKFVLMNKGICITTTLGLKTYFIESDKIKVIPIKDPPLKRQQAIAWPKFKELTQHEKLFKERLKSYCEIMGTNFSII